ncbi:MAG: 4Fe-4S binding protein [Candidatus Omnitrophica bacterium]|nr:4Fe-4S binding protein [Candidatus Omnitrophota bacterium]
MQRSIVKIDQDKCNGCGLCVPSCHEGAIRILNGKARLEADALCDGLGACLGECPQGAITIEQREAAPFIEEVKLKPASELKPLACGCPGSMIQDFRQSGAVEPMVKPVDVSAAMPTALSQWPVQLRLLNPRAPFFQDAELVVCADCVPFTYPDFQQKFLKGRILAVFCPKLDEGLEEYIAKLAAILQGNNIRSVTILRMEVPCCGGTVSIVEEAVRRSGKGMVIKEFTISLRGEII